MLTYKKEFIEFMVRSGVLCFGEFITKSGRKSPYFVNTGNYSTGEQLAKLGDYYAECINEKVTEDYDILFGPAYKGIPLASAAAISLYRKYGINKSFCFNRKETKDHGEGGLLIGEKPFDGSRILIIEDVITSGKAVRETMPTLLSSAKVCVNDMIISVDRMEKGQNGLSAKQEIKAEYGITVHSIVTVRDIMEHMHNRELDGKVHLTDEIKDKMEAYLEAYCE